LLHGTVTYLTELPGPVKPPAIGRAGCYLKHQRKPFVSPETADLDFISWMPNVKSERVRARLPSKD
ncbi:MAG TPA: hypothetical protein VGR78_02390, partial [Verrucomicrobiae bacterium]|nr:hypothetical protein [Verrucomicrobiae bacterium]